MSDTKEFTSEDGPVEHKSLCFDEFKSLDSEEEGTFEGYLSVFGNIDHDGDIVVKGAFSKTLTKWRKRKMMPSLQWLHYRDEPVGEWQEMSEDDHGLHVKGKLWVGNPTEAVRKAYNVIRSNAVKGLSIGYRVMKWLTERVDDVMVRKLKEIDLVEGSIAPWAANELAAVTAAKSLKWDGSPDDKKSVERILRDAGFSRREAKALLAGGYEELLRDAVSTSPTQEVEGMNRSIHNLINILKGE